VYVDKWGFKEGASTFKEPQVLMSVRDQDGGLVEAVQVGWRAGKGGTGRMSIGIRNALLRSSYFVQKWT
jgi:hypothetical protein